jgi:hypothetical protein
VPREYKKHLLDVIEHDAANKPRNLQRQIGPSGIGNPCNRCLGYALAEVPERPGDSQWLPFIGTAVHAQLEHVYERRNRVEGFRRWLTEERLKTGVIGDRVVEGNGDLFDTVQGYSIDWKIVGDNTLGKARKGTASATYVTQGHTYGDGHVYAGRRVQQIIIAYLPRNAMSIYDAVLKSFPYDPAVSAEAFRRANAINDIGQRLGWFEALSRLKSFDDCWDCRKNRQYTPTEAKERGYIST